MTVDGSVVPDLIDDPEEPAPPADLAPPEDPEEPPQPAEPAAEEAPAEEAPAEPATPETPAVARVSLRELVAGNVRRLRTNADAKPDEVVRAAGQLGLEWTASWVNAVEKGQKALTAEQLIALPFVLSLALGHRVCLADLLLGEDVVLLGQHNPVPAAQLRETVTEKPYRLYFTLPDAQRSESAERRRQAGAKAAEKVRILGQANLGDVDIRALHRAEAGAGADETRLARKLGVPEIVVIAAAASLWGRSLTEERDAQLEVPEGVNPPAKASVNRKLSAALAERIASAAESPPHPVGPSRLARIVRRGPR